MAALTLTNGADAVAPLKRDLDPAAFSDQKPHPLSGDFAWALDKLRTVGAESRAKREGAA